MDAFSTIDSIIFSFLPDTSGTEPSDGDIPMNYEWNPMGSHGFCVVA